MKEQPTRAIIASRILDVDGEPSFTVQIAQPFLEPDGVKWCCEYTLTGPITQRSSSFCGVDAVQALLNVLYVLSVDIEASAENQTGRLSWGGQRAHFGFPAPEADPERMG